MQAEPAILTTVVPVQSSARTVESSQHFSAIIHSQTRHRMMNWSEEVVLVTGGTGSFGRKFVELMLREYHPRKLIIFSRDELKQHDMRAAGFDHESLRYFSGRCARCFPVGPRAVRSDDRRPRRSAQAGAGLRIQPFRGHPDQHYWRDATSSTPRLIEACAGFWRSAPIRPSTPSICTARPNSAPKRCLCRPILMLARRTRASVARATATSWPAAAA